MDQYNNIYATLDISPKKSPTHIHVHTVRKHRVTQVQSQCAHTHAHTFHPTCSVNREQDVADIWVHEQTKDAPRKRERETERARKEGWMRV